MAVGKRPSVTGGHALCAHLRACDEGGGPAKAGHYVPGAVGMARAVFSPRLAPRASFSSRNRFYLLTAILACRSVGRTIGNGALVTTSLTQRASPPLKYDVAFAWRNASMLGCSVPEAALVKPGSSNMTHDPWSISARLRETSGLSVFTRISVPARTVLWLPVILKSLPLRLSTMGC